MRAEQLQVGKVYKTFSFETALAILQESEGFPDLPRTIMGISKMVWNDILSEVMVIEGSRSGCVTVRGTTDRGRFRFVIPCYTIREEAQF